MQGGRGRVPRWIIIGILSLSGTVAALNQTLVIPLLPEFPGLLGVSRDDASWLVTATLLVGAVTMPIVTRLADMFGKRIMLLICLVLMTAGSLLAGTGEGFAPVLGGRALQGFGMALIPIGISIMRDALPPAKIGSAVALMSATLGIGGALGLPLSGFLYTHLGWQWIFWCSAILGAALIAAVGLLVPESTIRSKGRFDYAGAVLLSAALTGLLLVISKGSIWGWQNPATLAVLALSVIVFGLWIPVQLKLKQPLVDLRISSQRPVLLTNIASVLLGFGMFANLLLTTQQLQLPVLTGYGLGLSVSAAGLSMVPAGLAMVVLSPLNGYLLNRFGAKAILIGGAAVMGLGYVARIFLFDSVPLVIIGSTVVGIGTAVSYAAVPTLIMASVPATETTSANGLNTLLRQIGTSTSSAAVAGVLSLTALASDGRSYPVWESFVLVYLLASMACLSSAVIVVFVPGRAAAARRSITVPQPGSGHRIDGVVLDESRVPVHRAMVTVLREDGTALHWCRTDVAGRFSAAVPEPARYIVVASSNGEAAAVQVVDQGRGTSGDLVILSRPSVLAGTAMDTGAPVMGAVVTARLETGEFMGAVHTDELGRYALPSPPPGRYRLTLHDPASERSQDRDVIVSTFRAGDIDFNLRPL